jgi:hypothetical protein
MTEAEIIKEKFLVKFKSFVLKNWTVERRCNPSLTSIIIIIVMLFAWWYFRDMHYVISIPESRYIQQQNEARDFFMAEQLKEANLRLDDTIVTLNKVRENQNMVLRELIQLKKTQYDHAREIDLNARRLDFVDKTIINTQKGAKTTKDMKEQTEREDREGIK